MQNIPFITKFYSPNGFEAYYHIKNNVFYINTVEQKYTSTEVDEFNDFYINMQVVYTIPQITKVYARHVKPENTYYSLFIWYDTNRALMLHDNTSWLDTVYFKYYDIKDVLTTTPVNRKEDITKYFNRNPSENYNPVIFFDTKELHQHFDGTADYLFFALSTIADKVS